MGGFGAKDTLLEEAADDATRGTTLEDEVLGHWPAYLLREIVGERADNVRVETSLHQRHIGIDSAVRVERAVDDGHDALHERESARVHVP